MKWLVVVALVACERSQSPTPPSPTRAPPPVAAAVDAGDSVRDQVLAYSAAVTVIKGDGDFPDYRDVIRAATALDPVVVASSAFTFTAVTIQHGEQTASVQLKGVDPRLLGATVDLERHMVDGTLKVLARADGPPPIVIGRDLEKKLYTYVGAKVTVRSSPDRSAVFQIAGIFAVGDPTVDSELVLAPFDAAQRAFGLGDRAMGVELGLADVGRSDEVAKRLGDKLGSAFQVLSWSALSHRK